MKRCKKENLKTQTNQNIIHEDIKESAYRCCFGVFEEKLFAIYHEILNCTNSAAKQYTKTFYDRHKFPESSLSLLSSNPCSTQKCHNKTARY